jgi:TrmH family RNA methyltransferase
MFTSLLNRVNFVLVETSHPGNVGACARAMKTMGLQQLTLVNPQCDPLCDEAIARASGAEDLLRNAKRLDNLEATLEGVELVVGTSARPREISLPVVTPRSLFSDTTELQGVDRVNIVFGRERNGLTNEELSRCDRQLIIPTNTEYASLNLGAAAQVIAYEVRVASEASVAHTEGPDKASAHAVAEMIAHAQSALENTSFTQNKPMSRLLSRLKCIYAKANLTPDEVDLMRGIWRLLERMKAERHKGDKE